MTFSRTFICNCSWSIFFRILSGSRRLDSTALTPLVQVFALAMCLFFLAMMWLALATEGKRIGGLQIPQPKGFRWNRWPNRYLGVDCTAVIEIGNVVACASASASESTPVRIDLYDASALPTFPPGKPSATLLEGRSVTSIVSLQDGSLAVGGSDAESEPRVYLFSVDALNNAGSNAPETASLAVSGPSFDQLCRRHAVARGRAPRCGMV